MAALFDGNSDNVMAAMFDGNSENISPNMDAIFDSNGNNVSSVMAAMIDLYSNCIFPRCYVDELPEDLWIEIFIRLPGKSLMLVMCVCKRWDVLIKNPSFRCRHLQSQKMVSKNSGHFLLLHHQEHENVTLVNNVLFHAKATVVNNFVFDGNSITSSATPSSSYRNILHFSPGTDYLGFEIDGPVNGLYCLYNENGYTVIWNPATNEVGFLPVPEQCIPFDSSWERYFSDTVVGFGTDPLDEKHYKVILISKILDCGWDDEFVYGLLYTTKTNTWRLLFEKDVPMVVHSLNNTCLNGFYYWKVANKCTTIVFDMSKKEEEKAFREISTPCDGDLALHKDHITMFFANKNLNEVDVWVMLEETSNNWLKKISVKGIQEPVVKSLGFWKTENEMLIVIDDIKSSQDTQTVLYNTTTREIRNIGPRGDKDGFKAFVYYESLESLTGGITKCKANDAASFLDLIWDFFVMESPVF